MGHNAEPQISVLDLIQRTRNPSHGRDKDRVWVECGLSWSNLGQVVAPRCLRE